MRVETRQNNDERAVVTGMILSPVVCGAVASKWAPGDDDNAGLFPSTWANTVAGWCVDYYRRYDGAAPGKAIKGIFESWAAEGRDVDTVGLLEKFLTGLNDDYEDRAEEINPAYLVDIASRLFNRVAAGRLRDRISGALDSGADGDIPKHVQAYTKIELGTGSGLEPFTDDAVIRAAFEDTTEGLIRYRGALGEFFGHSLARDGFVAFQGVEKSGKTWLLIDAAVQAVRQRRKVAFFEVGDMTQNQMVRRLAQRVAWLPTRGKVVKRPVEMEWQTPGPDADAPKKRPDPNDATRGQGKRKMVLKYVEEEKGALTYQAAAHAFKHLMERQSKSNESLFRLSVHPTKSINVEGVRSILVEWERQGWVPDVVCVDYPDIMSAPAGCKDSLEAIDITWAQLRAISQRMHNLVLVVTQAKASAYKAEVMDKEHFSGNKAKIAHVTGMIGINQTPEDRAAGMVRLNWIARRDEHSLARDVVYVAQCIDIGQPALLSCF